MDGPLWFRAFCCLFSLAWAGHAASGVSHRAQHMGADIGHLAIASVWPVGLLPLALYALAVGEDGFQLSQLTGAVATLRRFSRTSFDLRPSVSCFSPASSTPGFDPEVFRRFSPELAGQLLLGKIALFLAMAGAGRAEIASALLPQGLIPRDALVGPGFRPASPCGPDREYPGAARPAHRGRDGGRPAPPQAQS